MYTDCVISPFVNKKGYSQDWVDIVRPNVLRRDKYRCTHCGLSNRVRYTIEGNKRVVLDDAWLVNRYTALGFKVLKVQLQIAHQCNTKACCNESHLITLCSSCHLRYDKHIHVITRLKNAANKRQTQ